MFAWWQLLDLSAGPFEPWGELHLIAQLAESDAIVPSGNQTDEPGLQIAA